jgi:uncharacterized protein YsxB (DUF464 family)
MIEISRNVNCEEWTLELTIEGHANQAEYGKDIVCASASMLVCTLAQYTFDRTGERLSSEIKLDSGDAKIYCKCHTMEMFAKMSQIYCFVFLGCEMLAESHPDFVQLISW